MSGGELLDEGRGDHKPLSRTKARASRPSALAAVGEELRSVCEGQPAGLVDLDPHLGLDLAEPPFE
jgi:hypothetical protein